MVCNQFIVNIFSLLKILVIADGIEIETTSFFDLFVEILDHGGKSKTFFWLLLGLLRFGFLLKDHEEKSSISNSSLIEFVMILKKFTFEVELGLIKEYASLGLKKSLDVLHKLVIINIEVGDGVSIGDRNFHF